MRRYGRAMRKLTFVLLLIAHVALAKTYPDNKLNGNHDCGKDGELVVQGNDNNFVVTGACEKVTVNGNHNNIRLESAKAVTINGNENNVSIDAADAITT